MNVEQVLGQKGRDIIAAKLDQSVGEVCALLAERRIGAVPVLDGERLAGMMSERDVIRGIAIRGEAVLSENVETLMTKSLHTCTPQDSVDHLMTMMTDRRIRHVPVLDGEKLVGMISIGDVVKHKISETVAEAEALKSYIASG